MSDPCFGVARAERCERGVYDRERGPSVFLFPAPPPTTHRPTRPPRLSPSFSTPRSFVCDCEYAPKAPWRSRRKKKCAWRRGTQRGVPAAARVPARQSFFFFTARSPPSIHFLFLLVHSPHAPLSSHPPPPLSPTPTHTTHSSPHAPPARTERRDSQKPPSPAHPVRLAPPFNVQVALRALPARSRRVGAGERACRGAGRASEAGRRGVGSWGALGGGASRPRAQRAPPAPASPPRPLPHRETLEHALG